LARSAGIRLIWQSPCHEALLLRHLENCATLRPATCQQAHAELRRRWPEYRKGMSASDLAIRLNHAEVARVRQVERELDAFLNDIGFI
ncbi:MAG: hypothetical protein ACREF1_12225, partial [Acetobacteraceae bacterium]